MKAKYNATGNYLEELPEIDEPIEPSVLNYAQDDWGFDRAMNHYRIELAEYKAHLEDLRRPACHPSCVGKWSDGDVLEEGKDYEVKSQFLYSKDPDVWKTFDQPFYRDMAPERFIAFYLPVKSEDDLWKEAAEKLALTFFGDEPVGSQGYYAALLTYEGEMEVLKQYFTLTKK